jgi:chromosomal replication initiation ATPase DnaA
MVRFQSVVAAYFKVDPQTFRDRRSRCIARDLAAWLCRQLTTCTLRELAAMFGLGHPDSVRNLTRLIDRALLESRKLQQAVAAIRHELPN